MHWPPLEQGLRSQSSMLTSHISPVQPGWQTHLKRNKIKLKVRVYQKLLEFETYSSFLRFSNLLESNLLVSEKFVNADAVDAVRVLTDIFLDLATFAGESNRTIAPEVVNQISTVGSQQTGLFGTVVDVLVAQDSLISSWALADKASLKR